MADLQVFTLRAEIGPRIPELTKRKLSELSGRLFKSECAEFKRTNLSLHRFNENSYGVDVFFS